ncbi:MAG TPA: hypothetical protein VFR67_17230 [Pilimelia sp.]|nr:hypothetical protein [Pilimelia sp.]
MTDRHDAPRPGDAAPPSRPGQASPDDRGPSTAPDVDGASPPGDIGSVPERAAPPAYDDGDSRVFLEGDG